MISGNTIAYLTLNSLTLLFLMLETLFTFPIFRFALWLTLAFAEISMYQFLSLVSCYFSPKFYICMELNKTDFYFFSCSSQSCIFLQFSSVRSMPYTPFLFTTCEAFKSKLGAVQLLFLALTQRLTIAACLLISVFMLLSLVLSSYLTLFLIYQSQAEYLTSSYSILTVL